MYPVYETGLSTPNRTKTSLITIAFRRAYLTTGGRGFFGCEAKCYVIPYLPLSQFNLKSSAIVLSPFNEFNLI